MLSLNRHPPLTDEQRDFAVQLFQEVVDFADEIRQRLCGIYFPRIVEMKTGLYAEPDTGHRCLGITYVIHGIEYKEILDMWNEVSQEFGRKFHRMANCFDIAFETAS